ncbi:hypothetical protein EJ06DRAFT_474872 [Trichodelitschia bisporula]|uniref:Uncharacterized protein n=1 Tax=Trichodelitschia bisporula TaxID=703511 RepID=A0A6G1I0Q1_9PEZI|nr:hypothetical protein EJ06DRAFT_474872 [Trichodelitschia bisporula]
MRGEVCGIDGCRSRRYRADESGQFFCQNGHLREGARVRPPEDEDAFTAGGQGRTTRRQKEAAESTRKHFRGRRAFELYLLASQLVLRKQVWSLIKEKGFPEELEMIVHDLWALRLQSLSTSMDTDPFSDTESQTPMYSSQSEDTGAESDATSVVRTRSTPKLVHMLALCYMGAYLLRLPVFFSDFFTWVTEGELLYYRAINAIPHEMRNRMPGSYQQLLDPRTTLNTRKLHKAVVQLFHSHQRDFGFILPPLNFPLHLFRYIKELALPLEVYPAARRLAALAKFDFKYPDKPHRRRAADCPELQLISTVIVAVKLLYPMDGIKRYPTKDDEPSAAIIDWESWDMATKAYEDTFKNPDRLGYSEAMQVKEADVLDMSEEKLDDYLDWYSKSWLAGEEEGVTGDADFRRAIFEMFPVGESGAVPAQKPTRYEIERLKIEKLRAVQTSLKPRRAITEDEELELGRSVPRPGNHYRRYRKESELEGYVKRFYEVAARLAGFPLKTVVDRVFAVEVELIRQVKRTADQEEDLDDGMSGMSIS